MINNKDVIKALNAFEKEKGLGKDTVIDALKEAIEKGYIKQLGQTDDMADAMVRCDIDPKKGTIRLVQMKTVMNDDDITDDLVQISVEDANDNADGIVYNVGDTWEEEVDIETLRKLTAQNIKSVLKQKLAEAEKAAVFAEFSNKKDEMVSGTVEKVDEKSLMISLRPNVNVYLPKSALIAGETFKVGDPIKVYVVDVVAGTKGPQITISRSDPGYLKRLFENEVHEIYDGTVVIKAIARRAGERSKVAVYSTDPNVDPIGACIGNGGGRVQAISTSLGNSKEKEKIDVIAYNENPALYIAEALKPATVIGVALDPNGNHSAVAVVKNEELSLAIGKKGVNASLAVKLTGWNIDIKELDDAMRSGIQYKTIEQIKSEEAFAKLPAKEEASEETPVEEVESSSEEETSETYEEAPVADTSVAEEVKPTATETVSEVKPEPVKEEPKTVKVHTSVSLDALEKGLEAEKQKIARQNEYANRKRNYKKNDAEEEEAKEDKKTPVDTSTFMPVYTDAELEEMENETEEEENKYDEDIDYDEFDSYYDSDK